MYLLHGKLTARAGHRDDLADILLQASQLVASAQGCRLYIISKDDKNDCNVYITEIWNSKEDHDESLKAGDIRALITKAFPLIDGQPQKGDELSLIGGFGIQTSLT